MEEETIISRLCCVWIGVDAPGNGCVTEQQARSFLALYREMQDIDREIAEEQRVAHARRMSQPDRYR